MRKRSVFKNYLYNLSYQILVIILPLVTTPYVSRVMGPENIGVYSYTASLVSYFALAAALGFSVYGQREIAYAQTNRHLQSIRFFEILISKALTVSVALVGYGLFVYFYKQYQTVLLIQCFAIINVLFDITWFYQGLEDFRSVTIRNLLIKTGAVAAIFILVKTRQDLNTYILIQVLSFLFGNLAMWAGLRGKLEKVSPKELAPFANWKTVFELFLPLIAVQVYNVLDKTMLGMFTGSRLENGYYEQTTKIVSLLLTVITSLGTIALPHVAAAFADDNRKRIREIAEKAFSFAIVLSCPLAIGLIAVARYFVPLFFGPGFDKVALLMQIYAWVIVIIPLSTTASFVILTPTKQHNKGTMAVAAGAVVNFTLNFLLIPKLLSVGASLATIVAELFVAGLHLYFVRKYVNVKKLFAKLIRYFICAVIMGCVITILAIIMNQSGCGALLITLVQGIVGILVYGALVLFIVKDAFLMEMIKNVGRSLREGRNG